MKCQSGEDELGATILIEKYLYKEPILYFIYISKPLQSSPYTMLFISDDPSCFLLVTKNNSYRVENWKIIINRIRKVRS